MCICPVTKVDYVRHELIHVPCGKCFEFVRKKKQEALENIGVDYSNLIGCADYKIPQTLRALEIVEYSDELASIVDNKTEIDVSSKYEVEIRASQLVVIEYIKERFDNVKAIDINDFLFLYSKKVKGIAKPYHLCRNTNY